MQTGLRSGVAVAVVSAGSCSYDWTPRLETSKCHRCSCKKKKKRTKEQLNRKKQRYEFQLWFSG